MADGYVAVARRADIASGTVKVVHIEGEAIAVCNVAGEFYAIEDRCTHDGASFRQSRLNGCDIECPRHGAVFDVRSGAVKALPAVVPVQTFPVRVVGETVEVQVDSL